MNMKKLLDNLLEGNLPGTALVIGRFQPITVAHHSVINMARRNFQNVYVVIIDPGPLLKEKKYTKKGVLRTPAIRGMHKRPFTGRFRTQLVHDAFEGKLDFKNIITAPTGFVPEVMTKVHNSISKEKLKKRLTLFSGTDRADEYRAQLEKELEIDIEPDVMEIKRNMDDAENISATKVREAIANDNKDEFKRLTPTGTHKYYEKMRGAILNLPGLPINEKQ